MISRILGEHIDAALRGTGIDEQQEEFHVILTTSHVIPVDVYIL